VVHLGAPLPCLDRAATWYPDWRVRPLNGTRPDVDIALLVIAAVERERLRLRPGFKQKVVRLEIPLPQLARVLAVGETIVHRRADRETGDQPPAGNHIDHGEF